MTQIEDDEKDYSAVFVSATVSQIKQTPQVCPTADQKSRFYKTLIKYSKD